MGPIYKLSSGLVSGFVDAVKSLNLEQSTNVSPYLFRGPLNDLIKFPHLDGNEVHMELANGPLWGNFLHDENSAKIELIIPYKLIGQSLYHAIAYEGIVFRLLEHTHQLAEGKSFESLTNYGSEGYINSPLAQEAVKGEISYLVNEFTVLAGAKALEISHRVNKESPGNEKLQDFIDKAFKGISGRERKEFSS